METRVSNLNDLIVAYICVTGELNYEQYVNSTVLKNEYKQRYLHDTVAKMCKAKLIRKYKGENGEIYLRLCYPKGEQLAKEISLELFLHYCLLAGKGAHDKELINAKEFTYEAPKRFNRASNREIRREQTSKIIFRLKEQEIYSDFIKVVMNDGDKFSAAIRNKFDTTGILKPLSLFESNGDRVHKKAFMEMNDDTQPCFIINRALLTRDSFHDRADLTKTIGVLFQNKKAFLVYYYTGIAYGWNMNAENVMKDIYKKDLKSFPQDKSPDGIFFVDDMETLIQIVSSKLRGNRKRESIKRLCEPLSVFQKAYMFPVNSDTEALIDILLDERGEAGFNETVHQDNYASETDETARLGQIRFYNLSFLNFEKLIKVKSARNKARNVAVGVMSWQKEAIIKYLKMTKEEANDLVIEMDEEIKKYAEGITGKEYL